MSLKWERAEHLITWEYFSLWYIGMCRWSEWTTPSQSLQRLLSKSSRSRHSNVDLLRKGTFSIRTAPSIWRETSMTTHLFKSDMVPSALSAILLSDDSPNVNSNEVYYSRQEQRTISRIPPLRYRRCKAKASLRNIKKRVTYIHQIFELGAKGASHLLLFIGTVCKILRRKTWRWST